MAITVKLNPNYRAPYAAPTLAASAATRAALGLSGRAISGPGRYGSAAPGGRVTVYGAGGYDSPNLLTWAQSHAVVDSSLLLGVMKYSLTWSTEFQQTVAGCVVIGAQLAWGLVATVLEKAPITGLFTKAAPPGAVTTTSTTTAVPHPVTIPAPPPVHVVAPPPVPAPPTQGPTP